MNRDAVLSRVRGALGRIPGEAVQPVLPPVLKSPEMRADERVALFIRRFEALGGVAVRVAAGRAACEWMRSFLGGRTAVVSNAEYLAECGIVGLPGVQTGFLDGAELKAACSVADVGITGVDYALAATGTLVMLAGPENPRLISLLPPVHVAVFSMAKLLTGLDELLSVLPRPAEQTSSMVLITGPSRTGDIEGTLVRGVHGPGSIYAVIVEE